MLAARAHGKLSSPSEAKVTELGPIAFVGAAGSGDSGAPVARIRIAANSARVGSPWRVSRFLAFGRTSGEWLSEAAGIRSRTSARFGAIAWLRNQRFRHLIQIYARPAARLTLGFHGRMNPNGLSFLWWSWQENWARRQAQTLNRLLIPIAARCLRCHTASGAHSQGCTAAAVCLLPPVPRAFYVPAERPKAGNKMTVSYLGRLDPAKGAVDAKGLITAAGPLRSVRAVVHGIYVSGDASSTAVTRNSSPVGDRVLGYSRR
jgi:hypothetical protein